MYKSNGRALHEACIDATYVEHPLLIQLLLTGSHCQRILGPTKIQEGGTARDQRGGRDVLSCLDSSPSIPLSS